MEESRLAQFMSAEKMQALKQEALESTFGGLPVCEMTHDEQLAVMGYLIQKCTETLAHLACAILGGGE